MKTFGARLESVKYRDRPGAYGFLRNADGRLALIRTPSGLFLPGGGVEAGETTEVALAREFMEELGYRILSARLVGQASQYHRSNFYGQDFHKIGSFFEVTAEPVAGAVPAVDHRLEWRTVPAAAHALTQEYQRWATTQWG